MVRYKESTSQHDEYIEDELKSALQLLAECFKMNGMDWSWELEQDVQAMLSNHTITMIENLEDVRGER